MPKTVETVVYLQVAPSWGWAPAGQQKPLEGIKILGATKNPPTKQADSIVCKLRLVVPETAFAKFAPSVTIEIPEQLLAEIVVQAEDANDATSE